MRRWMKRGAGLGGLVLLAVIGWLALRQDPVAPEPTATDIATADLTAPAVADDPEPPPIAAVPEAAEAAAQPPPQPAAAAPQPGAAPGQPTADGQAPAAPDAPTASTTPEGASPSTPDSADAPSEADSYVTIVRLEKGDTISSVLQDLDFAPTEIGNAVQALSTRLTLKRLQIGQALTLEVRTPEDADAKPILQTLTIRPDARREVTLQRDDDGTFSAAEKIFDVIAKLVRASGVVDGSLIASADAAGVPRPALAEMVRAFSWDVNFQHDMKAGDRFAVLIEQSWTTDGRLVDSGRVLWAELTTGAGQQTYSIYRFKPQSGADGFYYGNGQSVVKALLRTPLSLSRISSRFGMRRHPVLGFSRMHKGIDFAAPPGTPILAAGAGQVVQAGRNGGYGNWVKLRHGRGLATGYAHMSRVARGLRPGHKVRQGQVIGFVGSTGMSTGPHLHFELHRNGIPVNPLTVAQTSVRASLAGADLTRFKAAVARINRARADATVLQTSAP
ncbi:M23 family metallopeptidase [Vineibacter terrae]|uniref:M23 family metallopeptidase n=1 Tax=Vineibacter terrae TaxID=2586908 RepID=UPI002E305838|nr:peptidoglycan DD-metalloendopeptidase family protein [Vineibacter terrae]HEX2888579.1 peptidoglycan DD-metalloendopeptidase family protein [Vineibacter terrae]